MVAGGTFALAIYGYDDSVLLSRFRSRGFGHLILSQTNPDSSGPSSKSLMWI